MRKSENRNLTRRQLVKRLGHSVAAVGFTPRILAATAKTYSPRSLSVLSRVRAFDLHTHPGMFFTKDSSPNYQDAAVYKTVSEMANGHLGGAFFSMVMDIKVLEFTTEGPRASRSFEPNEAWLDYQRQLSVMRKLIHVLPAKIATTLQDLDAANRSRVAAFLSCEGGDCIEHKPERLETMFADGVRSIQLVHYAQNQIGDLQSSSPKFNGLSAVGKEIVIGMDRLGMVIDVAHATAKTVQDVLHISDLPIILSHSQLKRGKNQHPRLITKDHARLVADSGGVIGMWPSGFGNATFDEFVDNTLRLIDVVGVEHVGLGTDMDGNYKPVFDSYLQLPDWVEALFAKGLTEHEVNLVVGGNVHNLLQKVLK